MPSNSKWYVDGVLQNNEGPLAITSNDNQDRTAVIKVVTPGFDDKYVTVYLKAGQTQQVDIAPTNPSYVPYAKDSSGGGDGGGSGGSGAAAKAPTQIIFGSSFVGAMVWLDTVQVTPTPGQAYGITAGYHAVKATKAGYDDWNKTVYCMENTTLNVDAAFIPTSTTTTKTGTGTGTTTTTTDTKAHVVFGQSVVDATVSVDGVVVSVTPGTVYDFEYGYHGILIQKSGYDDWTKTVYLQQGDTLTVSPVLIATTTTTTTTTTTPTSTSQRVYINTSLDNAKILINGGFTGDWTPGYVDLEPGYYTLTLVKTGYVDYDSFIYVGDTIAFGAAATALAVLKGLITQ